MSYNIQSLWQQIKQRWLNSYIYLVFFWRVVHHVSLWRSGICLFSWFFIGLCFLFALTSLIQFAYPVLNLEKMNKNIGIVKEVNFLKGKFTYDNITLLTDDGKKINYRYGGHKDDKQLIGQRVTVWSQNKWMVYQFKDELHELQKEDGEFLKNYTYEKALEFRERQKNWAENSFKTGIFFLFIIWLTNRNGLVKSKITKTGEDK